eukprot:scaffold90685_cov69-Phaeocystis_antarctica.AAC.1
MRKRSLDTSALLLSLLCRALGRHWSERAERRGDGCTPERERSSERRVELLACSANARSLPTGYVSTAAPW